MKYEAGQATQRAASSSSLVVSSSSSRSRYPFSTVVSSEAASCGARRGQRVVLLSSASGSACQILDRIPRDVQCQVPDRSLLADIKPLTCDVYVSAMYAINLQRQLVEPKSYGCKF